VGGQAMDNTVTILYSTAMVGAIEQQAIWPFVNLWLNLIQLGVTLAIFYIVRGQKGLSSGIGVIPTVLQEKPPQSGPNSTFVKGGPEDVGANH